MTITKDQSYDGWSSAARGQPRARDILATLLERPGEIVRKRELIERAWPHSVVEAGTLRVHISALRRALEDDSCNHYIENVTGQGYRFVAPVTAESSTERMPGHLSIAALDWSWQLDLELSGVSDRGRDQAASPPRAGDASHDRQSTFTNRPAVWVL